MLHKRENPIYIFLREKPNKIDVNEILREKFKITKNMKILAKILAKELKLHIFGFDLIKPIKEDGYYLVDLNDFPGFRGIDKIEEEIIDYFKTLLWS